MCFAPAPQPPPDPGLDQVAAVLDPVLVPLGFAPGQAGAADGQAQVIFCRGDVGGVGDGCVDLVIELVADPRWRIVEVRYWGFPSDRWRLGAPGSSELTEQLDELARSLPARLPPAEV